MLNLLRKEMSTFPKIIASPNPGMFDEPIDISLEGLPPSKIVTIYAKTVVTKHCFYESFANYETCRNGTVNITKDASLKGTYTGVEPMGLMWSVLPHAESKKKIARLSKFNVTTPQVYHVQVFDEPKQSLEECRTTKTTKAVAATLLNRWFMAPGVRRIPIRTNGIIATLLLPPGKGPFPGVINLFGGFPGILEYKSSLHASHGFASLALAYTGVEHLPVTMLEKLDLEYFEKAVQFMMNCEHVQSDHGVGVFAICKGAQVANLMATYLDNIRCVVSINGTCMTSVGTYKYKNRHFDVDYLDYSKIVPNEDNNLADYVELPQPGTVETVPGFFPFHKKRNVSYMLVSGTGDTCMPSFFSAEMERLLREENHPDFEILKYTDAGHLIEPPNIPFVGSFYQPGDKMSTFLTNGGKLESHMKSQEDSWPKMLRFLKQRLSTKPSLQSKL